MIDMPFIILEQNVYPHVHFCLQTTVSVPATIFTTSTNTWYTCPCESLHVNEDKFTVALELEVFGVTV